MTKKKAPQKARTKRVVSPLELEKILIECVIEVGKGLPSNQVVTEKARTYWHVTFKRTIARALRNRESWAEGRKTVLPLARAMGAEATKDAAGGPITKEIAIRAADKVRADPGCPGGGGKFC